jgi:spore coat polysaccharide biosynthesis predicted glycosyltransferase SpsG
VTGEVLLTFDEGPGAGLGHRRRVEALAAELAGRGHDCRLLSLPKFGLLRSDVAVVDSYRVRADDRDRFRARVVVAIEDLARDLDVDIVVDPSPGATGSAHQRASRVLAGAAYALVPVADPHVPVIEADAPVGRVLVTTGAADDRGIGAQVAAAVLAAEPGLEVRLVVGPWGSDVVPSGVVAVRSPDGLTDELAAASIVVTAGGVTMLEACRLARPVIALELALNQRRAVSGLAREGAVVPATPESAAPAVSELAHDRGRRLALGTAAGAAIDGKGATRIADAIEQVVNQ